MAIGSAHGIMTRKCNTGQFGITKQMFTLMDTRKSRYDTLQLLLESFTDRHQALAISEYLIQRASDTFH